jgi:hypothetical protein
VHTGTDPNSGWTELVNGGVMSVSVGVDANGNDAAFVDVGGTLLEHRGTNPRKSWTLVTDLTVSNVMASDTQANTVFFTAGGINYEHTGLNPQAGLTQLS